MLWESTSRSSTDQPVLPTLLSQAIRKRIWMVLGPKADRFTVTWVQAPSVPDQAWRPAIGLLQPVLMVLV